mgnify:CR=1 FL=1
MNDNQQPVDSQDVYRQADYFRNKRCIAYYAHEQFLPFPLHPGYMVGNLGTVYSEHYGKKLTFRKDKDGYDRAYLGRQMGVHKAVMLAHAPIPNPDEMQINHKDGIKTNNVYYGPNDPRTNLEWVTAQENIAHACEHGLRHGDLEDHFNAIYTNDFIHAVCQCISMGLTGKESARFLGIQWTPQFQDLISKLRLGKSWVGITSQYPLVKPDHHKGR